MATIRLDNRTLEPPEPMIRILNVLPSVGEADELVALMDREPLFLYPELQRRGYTWAIQPAGEGYELIIRKEPG